MKISWLGVLFSLISFAKMNYRMLSVLISLEALMLSMLMLLFASLSMSGMDYHYFIVLLTFAACEAALGLSLLVSILRLRSSDYVVSFSSLKYYV